MKLINAIIRPEKLDEVREALDGAGFPGMTVTRVEGRGRQKGIALQWRAGEYRVEFLPKVKLEILVDNKDKDTVIESILEAAPMQKAGDGKIFVSNIEEVIRVRTGERGNGAL